MPQETPPMPMSAEAAQAAAHTLWDHRRRVAPLAALPEGCRPATADDAYAVQAALTALRGREEGARPIGWKIGATNAASRELLGVAEPFFGVLLTTATTDAPSSFAAADMFLRVIEPEIALEIGADLDPAAAPYDADAIRAVVRAVIPAIEIVDTPLAAGLKSGGLALIADGGAHGRWIRGKPVGDWQGLDLIEHRVTLSIDGALVREGRGGNVEGGPFAATAWLANALAARGLALRAGDVVTTGTTTQPAPAAAGQSVRADFGSLGAVEIAFT